MVVVGKIDLRSFFQSTYLRKIRGFYDEKLKVSLNGFKSSWDLYHFHHVCLRGGSDGIIVGFDDEKVDWKSRFSKKDDIMSEVQWNEMMQKKKAAKLPLLGTYQQLPN